MKPFLFLIVLLAGVTATCQKANPWNNRQCAVVLTYDDALDVHLDNVIPALDSLNLKGTFFLTAASPAFTRRLQDWKKAAQHQHELANHTLFHPCSSGPGRSFVTPDYDLNHYSLRRITDELKLTNTVLEALDGKKEHTFAYPCGDTKIGDTTYIDAVKTDFVAARGVKGGLVKKDSVDLYNVDCFVMNGSSGAELIALVKKAMETKTMLVFLFHGVGGGHAINVSLDAHNQLLHFLKAHNKEIWNPTFIEATRYIKQATPATNKMQSSK
ncbi:MAG TPA: polysaccharide deacetylase family protein [Chitinophagaceae bacterium]|nr:polysaccharide deacetylase family protein [Chitinophagaceae bacterium]